MVPFLQRELTARGIYLIPGTTVALAQKGSVPTLEEIYLLAGVGVGIADEGGVKMVGIPVGADEFSLTIAIGIVGGRNNSRG